MRSRSLTWEWSTTRGTGGNARGAFIALEGVEGAGKTTLLERLARELRERGIEPVVTREPGGTPVGEALREMVLDPRRRLDPVTELLLMLAARAALVREVVRPALEAGRVVLSDRFDLSSVAYQGGGRGLSLDEIRRLNALATGGLRADLTIVLDVGVGEGLGRKGGEEDRIGGGGREFHERVAEAYRALARSEPDVVLVDASCGPDEVYESARSILRARFPETFGRAVGSL
ncbi:MAG: dTMP kinase [Gemmatimonadetes bacterium]|nr:dTMP kinase [Gemmatimonadota bacterium]